MSDEPDADTLWILPDGAGDQLLEFCKRLIAEAEQNDGRVNLRLCRDRHELDGAGDVS